MLGTKETELMGKYGLKFDDFKIEDWRDIFDNYQHASIDVVKKYISPIKYDEFQRDLTNHMNTERDACRLIRELCKTLEVNADDVDFIELIQTIEGV